MTLMALAFIGCLYQILSDVIRVQMLSSGLTEFIRGSNCRLQEHSAVSDRIENWKFQIAKSRYGRRP
jgi:hypothetical protein